MVSSGRPPSRKIRAYDLVAPQYDAMMEHIVGAEALRERLVWATEVVEQGNRVLDLGCGSGRLLARLGETVGEGGSAVGADLSGAMLEQSRAQTRDVASRTSLVQIDVADALPFASDSFDCVCAFAILQEVATPRGLLEEIHRVTKPGGAFRGIATTYRVLNPAAEIHMAVSEAVEVYIRPHNMVASMFLQIFGPAAATRWEPNPLLTDPEAWDRFPPLPPKEILQRVREAGHDPTTIELGALMMTGRRLP